MEILILLVLMAVAVFAMGSIFVVPFFFLPIVVLGPILRWIARVELSILGIEPETIIEEYSGGGPPKIRNNEEIAVFLNGLVMGLILNFYAYSYRGASGLDTHWQALFSLLIPPGCGVSAWICYVIDTEIKARKNLRK